MKKFFDELNETTVTGGYPNDGSTGPASDDDGAPGTTVFGDKMVPVVVSNRLTGETIKYVPAADIGHEWNYDEFDNSKSMGSYKSYSDTLKGLNVLLGDRHWEHTDNRKFRMSKDKWLARRDAKDGGVKQTSKTGDDKSSHMELTKNGELRKIKNAESSKNGEYWREVDMKKIDIMERINDYLGEPESINEEIVDKDDRKGLVNAILKGKPVKLKLDSLGGISITITGKDDKVLVIYKNNEDLTMTLVDIADSLGWDFKVSKSGSSQHFEINK